MTLKLSLTSSGFPTQVWNSSEAIQRKVCSDIFFKRDHMSQDGLFWNNMPGQLINLWQFKHGWGKLCLSNSIMAAISSFLKISSFSKLEFCIYWPNIAGFKLSWLVDGLSEWLYNMGQSRSKFSRCQFSVWSQNQCYIFRWTLWHSKFGAVTKTGALGVILRFRGWISLYRASRQNVLFFTRHAG